MTLEVFKNGTQNNYNKASHKSSEKLENCKAVLTGLQFQALICSNIAIKTIVGDEANKIKQNIIGLEFFIENFPPMLSDQGVLEISVNDVKEFLSWCSKKDSINKYEIMYDKKDPYILISGVDAVHCSDLKLLEYIVELGKSNDYHNAKGIEMIITEFLKNYKEHGLDYCFDVDIISIYEFCDELYGGDSSELYSPSC